MRSLDPHQVKLVEACQRGLAATGDPAFAAAAGTVTSLRLPMARQLGPRFPPRLAPSGGRSPHRHPLSEPLSQLRRTSVLAWPHFAADSLTVRAVPERGDAGPAARAPPSRTDAAERWWHFGVCVPASRLGVGCGRCAAERARAVDRGGWRELGPGGEQEPLGEDVGARARSAVARYVGSII